MKFYGANHGNGETDIFIKRFFEDGYIGRCIEIGAADGIMGSNTKHFEEIGWECLCIEANPINFEKCKLIRKNVVWCAVSDNKDYKESEFTICTLEGGNQTAVSSLKVDERLFNIHKKYSPTLSTVKVPTKNLDCIIEENNFNGEIDFISLDIEGTELDVLKGFSINKYSPKLFVIENAHNENHVENYLFEFNYVKVFTYVDNDFYIMKKYVQ